MPLKLNNPASRLHRILVATTECNPNASIGGVWGKVLGTNDPPKLITRIGLVYALPSEIEMRLQQRPEYDPHEMAWWETLSKGIASHGLNTTWSNIVPLFNPDVIGAVRSRARVLSRFSPEPMIPENELDLLRQYLSDMETAMKSDDGIDSDMAEFCLLRIARMRDLLEELDIVGAFSIKYEVETLNAELMSQADNIQESAKKPTWNTIEKWLDRSRKVFSTITVAATSFAAIGGAYKAISWEPKPAIEHHQSIEERKQRTGERNTKGLPLTQNTQKNNDAEDDVTDATFKDVTR